jgi:DNA-binding NarL/FixJ family response regulator
MLVSLEIEDILDRQGCIVVGPYSRVSEALLGAQTETIDIAILDMNVAGMKSRPVADVLHARGIPFFFLSGYGRDAAPSDHPEWLVHGKPFTEAELVTTLRDQIARD